MSPWMQTYTRKRFTPLAPRQEDINLRDIAHALAMVNRFNGHTPEPYSVAQHSILVAHRVWNVTKDRRAALWGLLHDASEAYLCDVPRPVKAVLGEPYADVEARVMRAICQKWGLDGDMPAIVRQADEELLATEARDLMCASHASWGLSCEPIEDLSIECWDWETAEARYIDLFLDLCDPP